MTISWRSFLWGENTQMNTVKIRSEWPVLMQKCHRGCNGVIWDSQRRLLNAGDIRIDKKEPAGQKSRVEHSRQREQAKSLRRSLCDVWPVVSAGTVGGACGGITLQPARKSGGEVRIYSKCKFQDSSANEWNCILSSPSVFCILGASVFFF